ncbi:uncharacterized protein [Parasteatoda tepidariorum]
MNFIIQLVSFLVFMDVVHLLPIQEDGAFGDAYEMKLAKRPFYPYREAILSPFGFLDAPREITQGQRKKAVDSTFIRFGRGSPSENRNARDLQAVSSSMDQPKMGDIELSDNVGDDGFKVSAQHFILNHNGCRVSNTRELMKALLSDPNCIRAFQKAKKENVNDTFIRFGKREAPPEFQEADLKSSSIFGER